MVWTGTWPQVSPYSWLCVLPTAPDFISALVEIDVGNVDDRSGENLSNTNQFFVLTIFMEAFLCFSTDHLGRKWRFYLIIFFFFSWVLFPSCLNVQKRWGKLLVNKCISPKSQCIVLRLVQGFKRFISFLQVRIPQPPITLTLTALQMLPCSKFSLERTCFVSWDP